MRFLLMAFVLLPFACRKHDSGEKHVLNTYPIDAKIVWSGPVGADGCDWLVKIDSVTFYHPDVLDAAFQHDGLNIKINFIPTNQRFTCGMNGMGPFIIRVTSIKK